MGFVCHAQFSRYNCCLLWWHPLLTDHTCSFVGHLRHLRQKGMMRRTLAAEYVVSGETKKKRHRKVPTFCWPLSIRQFGAFYKRWTLRSSTEARLTSVKVMFEHHPKQQQHRGERTKYSWPFNVVNGVIACSGSRRATECVFVPSFQLTRWPYRTASWVGSHIRRIFQTNRPSKQTQTGPVPKAHDSSLGGKTGKLLITHTDSHSLNQMRLCHVVDDD